MSKKLPAKFDKHKGTRGPAESLRTARDPKVVDSELFLYHAWDTGLCPSEFALDILRNSNEIALRVLRYAPIPEICRAYHLALQSADDEHSALKHQTPRDGQAHRPPALKFRHVLRAVQDVNYRELLTRNNPDYAPNTAAWLWLLITWAAIGDERARGGKDGETNADRWRAMRDAPGPSQQVTRASARA